MQQRRRERERTRLRDELILERGFNPADVERVIDQVLPKLLTPEEVSKIKAARPGESEEGVFERVQAIQERQIAAINALVANGEINQQTAARMMESIDKLALTVAGDKAGGSTPPANPPPRDPDKVVPTPSTDFRFLPGKI